jgi:hypothetical protein
MGKTLHGNEGLRVFPRQTPPFAGLPGEEKDIDDYEDFEDGEMLSGLWHQGEEQYVDELMAREDY